MIIVITTVGKKKEAQKIANSVLLNKLVACVNIIPCYSMYMWKGKIIKEKEWKLFMKSQKKLFTKIEKNIIEVHSYDTPEISCITVDKITEKYKKWIFDVTEFV